MILNVKHALTHLINAYLAQTLHTYWIESDINVFKNVKQDTILVMGSARNVPIHVLLARRRVLLAYLVNSHISLPTKQEIPIIQSMFPLPASLNVVSLNTHTPTSKMKQTQKRKCVKNASILVNLAQKNPQNVCPV